MKLKNESAITLIALLITIIILIVIASIAIKNLIEFNIVKLSTKSTENYAQAQVDEYNELEDTYQMLDEETKAIKNAQKKNHRPNLVEISLNGKASNSITVSAIATDDDNDELTYILYTKKENEDWKKNGSQVAQASEVPILITALNLDNSTYYYWKIEISDGIEKISSDTQEMVKTLCCELAYLCEGPYNKVTDCENCSNSGIIQNTCTGKITACEFPTTTVIGDWSCAYDGASKKGGTGYNCYWTANCGHSKKTYYTCCSKTHAQKYYAKYAVGKTCPNIDTSDCATCGGKIYCSHKLKKDIVHYYCSTHKEIM